MKDCCIVILTHLPKLVGEDEKSFIQVLKVFNNKRDIKLVIPTTISTEYYDKFKETYNFEYLKVNPEWQKSFRSYNEMRCNKDFYYLFLDYKYILTYETDAWVFYDNLDYFISLDYDYYGSPWPHFNHIIGNSGFCLQKVSKMIDITSKYSFKFNRFNTEGICDTWLCLHHGNDMNICDLENACNFSIENMCDYYKQFIKDIPMGLHGKMTYRYRYNPELIKQ